MGTHPIFESDFDCLTERKLKMVKLTADVIGESQQYVNACRERELDLRGYKFAEIENLGATLDQFDSFMMNDNDVKKVENFPYLPRLKVVYLANNRIRKINPDIAQNIINLKELNLANNELKDFADIAPLGGENGFKKLEYLVLTGNPIASQKNYRLYVIHLVPSLRVFDYKRISQKERTAAIEMFGGKAGRKLLKEMNNTFTPGGDLDSLKNRQASNLSEEDKAKIKAAILNAKSLEEVEILQQQLQMGHVPGKTKPKEVDPNAPEEESDDDGEKMDQK